MLIDHRNNLISIAVPKTGSTSLHYALMSSLGIGFHFKSTAPALYHLSARDVLMILGADTMARYFSFAVVRNPYDRLVSLFHDFKYQRGMIQAPDFDDFVLRRLRDNWAHDVHFRPQTFFTHHEGDLLIDEFFCFESGLPTILADVASKVAFTPAKVGHARRSERGPWQDYYTDRQVISVVNAIYDEDFERLGYERLGSG